MAGYDWNMGMSNQAVYAYNNGLLLARKIKPRLLNHTVITPNGITQARHSIKQSSMTKPTKCETQ